ncbi:MAG: hypothetical protein ACRCWR_06125 [Saezia sp.]
MTTGCGCDGSSGSVPDPRAATSYQYDNPAITKCSDNYKKLHEWATGPFVVPAFGGETHIHVCDPYRFGIGQEIQVTSGSLRVVLRVTGYGEGFIVGENSCDKVAVPGVILPKGALIVPSTSICNGDLTQAIKDVIASSPDQISQGLSNADSLCLSMIPIANESVGLLGYTKKEQCPEQEAACLRRVDYLSLKDGKLCFEDLIETPPATGLNMAVFQDGKCLGYLNRNQGAMQNGTMFFPIMPQTDSTGGRQLVIWNPANKQLERVTDIDLLKLKDGKFAAIDLDAATNACVLKIANLPVNAAPDNLLSISSSGCVQNTGVKLGDLTRHKAVTNGNLAWVDGVATPSKVFDLSTHPDYSAKVQFAIISVKWDHSAKCEAGSQTEERTTLDCNSIGVVYDIIREPDSISMTGDAWEDHSDVHQVIVPVQGGDLNFNYQNNVGPVSPGAIAALATRFRYEVVIVGFIEKLS